MTPEDTLRRFYTSGVPTITPGESTEDFLGRVGVLERGFLLDEIVQRGNRKKCALTTDVHHYRMAMTLAAANVFRERAMVEAGVTGLKVAAAFRPDGGASNSQHKYAAALDLDRIGGSGVEYFRCAVRFWCEWGAPTFMGLGLYTWTSLVKGGIRVHIDTDFRCRSWQGVRSHFDRPFKIKCDDGRSRYFGLPVKLANDMGLDVPSLEYL